MYENKSGGHLTPKHRKYRINFSYHRMNSAMYRSLFLWYQNYHFDILTMNERMPTELVCRTCFMLTVFV